MHHPLGGQLGMYPISLLRVDYVFLLLLRTPSSYLYLGHYATIRYFVYILLARPPDSLACRKRPKYNEKDNKKKVVLSNWSSAKKQIYDDSESC